MNKLFKALVLTAQVMFGLIDTEVLIESGCEV